MEEKGRGGEEEVYKRERKGGREVGWIFIFYLFIH